MSNPSTIFTLAGVALVVEFISFLFIFWKAKQVHSNQMAWANYCDLVTGLLKQLHSECKSFPEYGDASIRVEIEKALAIGDSKP